MSRVEVFTVEERRLLADSLERLARQRRSFERSGPYPEGSQVMVAYRERTKQVVSLLDEVRP